MKAWCALNVGVVVASQPIQVSVVDSSELIFFPKMSAPAQVVNLNVTKVPARIGEVLLSLQVEVGDQVRKGQVIATFDCELQRLDFSAKKFLVQQTNIQLGFAARQLQRAEVLKASNNLGAAELDGRKTDLLQAESQLKLSELEVQRAQVLNDRCEIKAPFTALVTARIANEGEFLNVGQSVIELTELTNVSVNAHVPLGAVTSFKRARDYWFQESGVSYPLTLKTLLDVIVEQQRSQMARFSFNETMAQIGLNGRVYWRERMPHLPASFLQKRQKQYGYFVADQPTQQAQFIVVQKAREGRPFPVNINEGRPVVLDGRHGLVDQQEISWPKQHDKER